MHLIIEIYREFRVFKRDLRMRIQRENYERRQLNEMRRNNNHNNNQDDED